jgi:hypothetical protein
MGTRAVVWSARIGRLCYLRIRSTTSAPLSYLEQPELAAGPERCLFQAFAPLRPRVAFVGLGPPVVGSLNQRSLR